MRGLVVAGWFPRVRRVGRPVVSPSLVIVTTTKRCEFCHNDFTCTGRRDRVRRTCSMVCAARLRSRMKQARGMARLKVEQAAKWLTFPKIVEAFHE